jgi:hypothetical protein
VRKCHFCRGNIADGARVCPLCSADLIHRDPPSPRQGTDGVAETNLNADCIGFATIGACVALLGTLVPDRYVPRMIWPFAFVALATCTWISWHHPQAPKSPRTWLKYIAEGLVIGIIMPALHAVTYGVHRRVWMLDFSVIGSLIIIVAAGLARSLAKGEQNEV